MKKYIILLLILLLPFNVLAYSDKIIPGGDTLGIEVKNKGVIIVGFYRVKSKLNKNNLKVGDTILKVNNEEVTCIDNMIKLIEKNIKDKEIAKYLDVLVDGQYMEELHNPKLKWKGSENQRVIDVQKSLKENRIITL